MTLNWSPHDSNTSGSQANFTAFRIYALKLCGTNQKLDNWVPELSANEKKKGLNARLQLKCTRTRSTLYEAKDARAAYCAALSLYAGWHTRFVASGVDRVSLLEKKERMKERKGSPWQQLLQFVGSNMCDDIIQHHWSEVPADAYPLYLSVKISSFEKKEVQWKMRYRPCVVVLGTFRN